jgi:CheY-like chemotaxis protein
MDIKMILLDGVDATGKIEKVNPKLPVIALTAYAMAGDREKMPECRMQRLSFETGYEGRAVFRDICQA